MLELLGLKGIFVDTPDKVGSAWDEAFAADRPVVVEAYTDPDVPPLPPHISLKNAKAFMSTLRKGDPNEFGIIKQSVKEFVEELLHTDDEAMSSNSAPPLDRIRVTAFKIPTDAPESDGTLAWDSTTLVLVEAQAAGKTGIGYSYANAATAALIRDTLVEVVRGRDAMAVPGHWLAMVQAIGNLGRPGIASMAIAAVDTALWDLKARLLDVPLVMLFGAARDGVPVYGSGGSPRIDRQAAKAARRLVRAPGSALRQDEGRPGIPTRTSSACARGPRGDRAGTKLFVDAERGVYQNRRSP